MTACTLMVQGTGSDVGKSLLVAGLCRIAKRRGLSVAPFKPQNMSNNAAACADADGSWGEIGRAQALQARAAGIAPHVDLNPVLLKPQSDARAQVIVHGRAIGTEDAAAYMAGRRRLLPAVLDSFARLTAAHDLVIVEGAGSPAEVNLRARDIANMGFARAAGVPVVLVGDIDRGGVSAALVGTRAVIDPADAAMIVGFAINKFRGDATLFDAGVLAIERATGWRCFGVIPWLDAAARLPAEDAVVLERPVARRGGGVKIVAPMLSRLANFDDADPLRSEPGVEFDFIPPGRPIPRDADAVILFGTKSTIADLAFLRAQGWDHDILAHARTGGRVLGVCGGFQMLGRVIRDPRGIEGPPGEAAGLGLLDIETEMLPGKRVRPVAGRCARTGASVSGYEIHSGRTTGAALERPMLTLEDGPDGAIGGLIEGTYVHGLFVDDDFRRAWLDRLGVAPSPLIYDDAVEAALDEVADGIARAVDVDALFAAARAPGWSPDA